jgi:hypothetical protein
MVDYSKEILLTARDRQLRGCLSPSQVSKLESIMARSYSDDLELRRGALTAPRTSLRPGQRDDAVHCPGASMMAVL